MKESNLSFCTFTDKFRDYFNGDYKDNFSYDGLKALYDYLEQYEEDCDTEIELDIIALCVEYSKYNNINEIVEAYKGTFKTDMED